MALDSENICRTCLGLNGPLLCIYDTNGPTNSIADMLKDFTQMNPTKNDGMPENVCLLCISEINRSFSFKIKCENSERMLRQLVFGTTIDEDQEETKVLKYSNNSEVEENIISNSNEKQDVATQYNIIMKCENDEITLQNGIEAEHLEENAIVEGQAMEQFITAIANNQDSKKVHIIRNQFAHVDNDRNEDLNQRENFVYEMQEQLDEETETVQTSYFLISEAQETEDLENIENEHLTYSSDVENEKQNCPPVFTIENFDEKCSSSEFQLAEVKPTNSRRSSRLRRCTAVDLEETNKNRNEIQCTLCSMSFVIWSNLTKHYQNHHFVRHVRLEGNQIIHSEPEKSLTNTLNGEIDCNDSSEIPVSITIFDKPTPVPVIDANHHCPRCNAGFAHQKSLNHHLKQNKCTVPAFVCHQCKKVFISEENLQEHLLTHNTQIECTKCLDKFDDKDKYNHHLTEAHNRKMKYQCNYGSCKKAFSMLSTYKDHVRVHTGERPFLCSICGKSFSQSANLKQHQMRHNKTKPFQCDECSTSFVSKGELFSHKRVHTGDHPFACAVCDAVYTTASSLTKHKRKHTGERPYACEFCPMRFTALNILKNHRRTHTGEKPFQCKYCNRSFAQKSDCTTHMRTHLTKKTFKCNICDKVYNEISDYHKHYNTHYKDVLEGKLIFEKSEEPATIELVSDDEDLNDNELNDNEQTGENEQFIEFSMSQN